MTRVEEREVELSGEPDWLASPPDAAAEYAVALAPSGNDGWVPGSLIGLGVRPAPIRAETRVSEQLSAIDRLVHARRQAGGTSRTGVVLLLGYELFGTANVGLPQLVALTVDASITEPVGGRALLTFRDGTGRSGETWERMLQGSPQVESRSSIVQASRRTVADESSPGTLSGRRRKRATTHRAGRHLPGEPVPAVSYFVAWVDGRCLA